MTTHRLYLLAAACAGLGAAAYFAFSQTQAAPQKPSALQALPSVQRASAYGASPFGRGAVLEIGRRRAAASGAPAEAIYGRNGRAVDFGGQNAAAYIAQWSSLARTGDSAAAYKVFQAADVCATLDEAAPDFLIAAEREQYLRERAALEKLCAGVTPAQVQERMRFLTQAARAGVVDAQIDFYMEGPDGRQGDLAGQADDPATVQWKEEALFYLKFASTKGEPFALALLSLVYDVGEVAPKDPRLSLAYAVADATARNVALTPGLRDRYGAQMSDADFNSAVQLGAQIAEACCKR